MEAFLNYVNEFDQNDYKIELKKNHSLRVMELAQDFSTKLCFDERDKNLAMIIGLYHDIGRFKQWQLYKTMNDLKSIDHGDEGVNIVLSKHFCNVLDEEDKKILLESIKWHNKYQVPFNNNSRLMMHCKLIRDLDKIDIMYIILSSKYEPDNNIEISNKVKEDFYNHKLINSNDVITKSDKTIFYLSFAYDLNFKESFTMFIEYVESIKNRHKELEEYFDEVIKYVRNQI